MPQENAAATIQERPGLMVALGAYAIFGCFVFVASVLAADFIVPDHHWISDTVSDLGAGKYEYIVDIGLYAFAGSFISVALLGLHVHLGNWGWSFGAIAFALLGLIVFLVGARNEYGDSDYEGVVIHIYLVYAIGVFLSAATFLMSAGLEKAGTRYGRNLLVLAIVWTVAAPLFFFMPDQIDGAYERLLGVIAILIVVQISYVFIVRGFSKDGKG